MSDEFPLGEFVLDEDDLPLTKKQRKRLRKAKEAEARRPQRFAVVILSWDRETNELGIEHPFVPFPEAAGIVNMADAVVRECVENGGLPS